ncbi:MAG: DNA repair protein RadA, partial [Hyphomicrobiaceae bacterium]|nr:DNA repair protein RadA [Hyphomicrobiaceae bacterium]
EISLSGAIRATGHVMSRLREAQKLGFKRAVLPAVGEIDAKAVSLELERLATLKMLADDGGQCD